MLKVKWWFLAFRLQVFIAGCDLWCESGRQVRLGFVLLPLRDESLADRFPQRLKPHLKLSHMWRD